MSSNRKRLFHLGGNFLHLFICFVKIVEECWGDEGQEMLPFLFFKQISDLMGLFVNFFLFNSPALIVKSLKLFLNM